MSASHNWPSIDHSTLSPSGRTSKRARAAALKREAARLFPPGIWDRDPLTPAQILEKRIVVLRRRAASLFDLAARGMRTKRYRREADALVAEAERLAAGGANAE